MEKLEKAYQAIDLLKSIDMPISSEQRTMLARMEREYLREEVIPLFEQEISPLVKNTKTIFKVFKEFNKPDLPNKEIVNNVSTETIYTDGPTFFK